MSEMLKELLAKLSSVKGRLTKFKIYLSNLDDLRSFNDIEISKLNIRLSKIENLFSVFEDLQTQIEVLNSSSLDGEIDERDNIELEFASLIATAQRYQSKYNEATSNNAVDVPSNSSCCHDQSGIGFKPPTLHIGKFDGSYFKWLEFRDLFCSLVHDNKRISPTIKFCYLNSYLEGEAARVISNLEVTESNYNKAWELLRERYDNKTLLIKTHMDALFEFDNISREGESAKWLRSIVDNINKNLRALSSLDEPTSHWDSIIIHLLSKRLWNYTSIKCEEYKQTLSSRPTLEQFNKFLMDRADILENHSHSRSKNDHLSHPITNKSNKSHQERQTKTFSTQIVSQNNISKNCLVCNGEHRIYECPNYKSKTILQRHELITKFKLYRNCLRPGYTSYTCLITPFTIRPKLLMQDLWLHKIDWDEPVPLDLQRTWDELKHDFVTLESVQIPRFVLCDSPELIELHSFSDASGSAHGATAALTIYGAKLRMAAMWQESCASHCPFTILNRKGRGAKTSKCYLYLFICFRYKCVHLEAVTELSKDAFVVTLRRFIARRGKPLKIYSDNGRNFVAAAEEIGSFLKESSASLSEYAATEHIKFNFIPSYASHFGGLWEQQQRTKWRTQKCKPLDIGDLVLLQEDHSPPLHWRLGRVIKLYPGVDGVSRVADVKTQRGNVRRPFARPCPLPISEI
ncbi:uncharacterized protein LOC124542806 [Vanessa cardui]|uniref:uncharacterized protein LOC124542806 n=1 Tax=Vanessa cardui TaxID=171605 RepID=UPI001F12EF1A|nr:uncharacterized protein LOC124542806 [Vanessa cardui]